MISSKKYIEKLSSRLRLCPFQDMPREFQISILIWNYNVNDEFDTSVNRRKIRWTSDAGTVNKLITDYSKYLSKRKGKPCVTKVGVVPTAELIRIIMEYPDLAEYGSFENYHRFYGKGTLHKKVLPIILDIKDEEVIVDGWNRFHGYVEKGVKEIPVVMYI